SSSNTTPIPTLGVIAYQAGSASTYNVSTSDINTTNAATTGLFGTEKAIEHLELRVLQNNMLLDNLFVRNDAACSEKGTDNKDLQKLANEGLNLYAIANNGQTKLAVDARNVAASNTIPLGIDAAVGNYTLQVANWNIDGMDVWLKDVFTGTTTALKNNSNYEFSITNNANSKGDNRFTLVFGKAANNIVSVDTRNGSMTAKWINGNINKSSVAQVEITNAVGKVEIRVTDMAGRLLHTQTGQNGRNTIQLGSKAGMQLITITDGTTTINQKMVKQ
ncbi:MAG: T9SS type A sorting domain-containing protein, partial [Chitinophagaceae bacterium]